MPVDWDSIDLSTPPSGGRNLASVQPDTGIDWDSIDLSSPSAPAATSPAPSPLAPPMPPGPMGAGPGARLPVDYAAEEGLDSPLWAGLKGAAAGVGAALPLVGRVSRRFAPPPIDTAPAPDAAGTVGTFGAQVLPGFTRGIPEMILAGRAGGIKGVMGAAAAGQADDLAYTEMLKRLQTGEEGNYLEDLATGSGIAASGPDDTAARRIMRGLTIPAAGGFAGLGGKLAGSGASALKNLAFDVPSAVLESGLNIGGQGGNFDPSQISLAALMAGGASLLGGRPRLPVSARSADIAPPPEIPVIPDAGPRPQPELPIIPRSPVSPEPAPVGDYGSRPAPSLPAILEGLEPPAPGKVTPPIEGQNAPTGQFEAKMAAEKGRDNAALAKLQGKKKELDPRAEADREYAIDKRVEYENAKTANPEFFAATEAAGMDPQAALDLLSKTPGNIKTARAKASEAILSPKGPAGAPLPETAQVTPPPVQPTDVRPPAGKIVPDASPERPQNVPTQEPASGVIQQGNKGISPETASPKIAPLAETLMSGVKRGMKESEPLPVAAPKAGEAEPAPATPTLPAVKEPPAPGLPEAEPGRALNKANLSKMRDVLDLGQYEKETQSLRETADKAISEGYAEPARVSALVQEVNTGKRTSISKEEHAGMVHRAVSLSDEQAKLYESLKTASPDAKREMLTAFDENQAHLRAIVTAADATGSEAGRRLNAQKLGFDREMDPAIIEARAEVKRGRPLTDKERARVQEAAALFKKSDESFNKASDIERGNRAFNDLAKGPKRPKAELDAEIGRLRTEAHALLKQGCKILG